jgi:hypothetical protein
VFDAARAFDIAVTPGAVKRKVSREFLRVSRPAVVFHVSHGKLRRFCRACVRVDEMNPGRQDRAPIAQLNQARVFRRGGERLALEPWTLELCDTGAVQCR